MGNKTPKSETWKRYSTHKTKLNIRSTNEREQKWSFRVSAKYCRWGSDVVRVRLGEKDKTRDKHVTVYKAESDQPKMHNSHRSTRSS